MKLTTRSEYALLAMIHLARNATADYTTVHKIAEARGISPKFLEQILFALKQSGYVRSSKGQHGGFRLAKSADSISLAEIIRVMDGALAPTESVSKYYYESTPIEKEKKVIGIFKDIRDYVSNKLEKTTLADVC